MDLAYPVNPGAPEGGLVLVLEQRLGEDKLDE